MYLKIKFLILTLLFIQIFSVNKNHPLKHLFYQQRVLDWVKYIIKNIGKLLLYLVVLVNIYGYNFYNKKFNDFKEAYIIRTDNNNSTVDEYLNYSETNLITLQDYYRNQGFNNHSRGNFIIKYC